MKKTFTLIVLFALLFTAVANSYTVGYQCTGDILLASQADVDGFKCTGVSGNLTISGEDITNLNALSSLQKINGNLVIEVNVNLETLDGLSALQSIGGHLYLRYDTILKNLEGLKSLTHAGGIYILDNHNIKTFSGLSSLQEVNGPISIQYNRNVTCLDGFTSLRSIHGEIRIANNDNLEIINGFNSVIEANAVAIVNNQKLIKVNGFGALTRVGDAQGNPGDILVEGNQSLTDLEGFSSLSSVNYFSIINNSQLSNLDDFSALRAVAGGLYLTDNAALSNINGVSKLDSIGGELRIQNNDNLVDLNAFASLKTVRSISIYENQRLSSIDGMSNVKTIGEGFGSSLWISNNDALTNVDGFNAVTNIGGPVLIKYNPALVSVNGFASLAVLKGHVEISNNERLTSINGFKALPKLSDSMFGIGLIINLNTSLTQFEGFRSLKEIEGTAHVFLEIGDNHSLPNMKGLAGVTRISGGGRGVSISIYRNTALKNIDGLSSLSTVNVGVSGSLYINDNVALENLDGLSALRGSIFDPPLYITVTQNAALTKCDGLYPYFESIGKEEVLRRAEAGIIQVADNGAGCTVQDILDGGKISVSDLAIIDTRTGDVVHSFINDSVTLDVADADFQYWAIQVLTTPAEVGSVEFIMDETPSTIRNQTPYIQTLETCSLGNHTVRVEVFSEADKGGERGTGRIGFVNIVNSASVVSFKVVNKAGNTILHLNDGAKINLMDPGFRHMSIQAKTTPAAIGFVKFWVNDVFFGDEKENPYTLHAENGSSANWRAKRGDYTLRAVPYVIIGNRQFEGKPLEIHFTVISEKLTPVVVHHFDILHTSGRLLLRLKDGDEISIDDPKFRDVAIMAGTKGDVGSLRFSLDSQSENVEQAIVYPATGSPSFMGWEPKAGSYTLTAVPYSKMGDKGMPLTIRFTVTSERRSTGIQRDAGEDNQIVLYPVPVSNELFVTLQGDNGRESSIVILNNQGAIVYTGAYHESTGINTAGLQPGVYHVKVISTNGTYARAKFVKL